MIVDKIRYIDVHGVKLGEEDIPQGGIGHLPKDVIINGRLYWIPGSNIMADEPTVVLCECHTLFQDREVARREGR